MSLPAYTEKRVQARANLKVPLAVFEHSSGRLIGHAVDISVGGLRVLSENYQASDAPILVSLKLPLLKNNPWQAAVMKIESVWSKYDPEDQATSIGFKFLEIETHALFAIQRLMDDHSSLA